MTLITSNYDCANVVTIHICDLRCFLAEKSELLKLFCRKILCTNVFAQEVP